MATIKPVEPGEPVELVGPLRRRRCNSEPAYAGNPTHVDPDCVRVFQDCLQSNLDKLSAALLDEHTRQLERCLQEKYSCIGLPLDLAPKEEHSMEHSSEGGTQPLPTPISFPISDASYSDSRLAHVVGSSSFQSCAPSAIYDGSLELPGRLSSVSSSPSYSPSRNRLVPPNRNGAFFNTRSQSNDGLLQGAAAFASPETLPRCGPRESVLGPLPSARGRLFMDGINDVRSMRSSISSACSTIPGSTTRGGSQKHGSVLFASSMDEMLSPSPSVAQQSSFVAPKSLSSLLGISHKTSDGATSCSSGTAGEIFHVLPTWGSTTLASSGSARPRNCGTLTADLDAATSTESREWILSPNSGCRLAWNLISVACISFDTWSVPLEILNFPKVDALVWISWFSRIFWTLDMLVSFQTGYVKSNGDVVMDRRKVRMKYLKTWFPFDLAIVSCDWVEIFFSDALPVTNVSKSVRIVRLLRIFRFLRLARVTMVIEIFFEQIHEEKLVIFGNLSKVMSLLVGLIHILACIWFAFGESSSGGWMKNELANDLNDGDYWHYYALAFHWAIAQFHGSSDLQPTNLRERIFANFALIFAFVVATWIVSSITSAMTRLDLIAGKAPAQFALLRRFLRCHQISHRLATRLQLNAHHTLMLQRRRIPEHEVELLRHISEQLLVELRFEIHSPPLLHHPVFLHHSDAFPSSMRKICHSAVSWVSSMVGDIVFRAGEVPMKPQMLVVNGGLLSYLQIAPAKFAVKRTALLQNEPVDVSPFEHLCEASLWTHWTFRGDLKVIEDAEFLSVDSDVLQEVGKWHNQDSLAKYAVEYVRELNRLGAAVTDLGNSMDSSAIVMRVYGSIIRQSGQINSSLRLSDLIKGFRSHISHSNSSNISVFSDVGTAPTNAP